MDKLDILDYLIKKNCLCKYKLNTQDKIKTNMFLFLQILEKCLMMVKQILKKIFIKMLILNKQEQEYNRKLENQLRNNNFKRLQIIKRKNYKNYNYIKKKLYKKKTKAYRMIIKFRLLHK